MLGGHPAPRWWTRFRSAFAGCAVLIPKNFGFIRLLPGSRGNFLPLGMLAEKRPGEQNGVGATLRIFHQTLEIIRLEQFAGAADRPVRQLP